MVVMSFGKGRHMCVLCMQKVKKEKVRKKAKVESSSEEEDSESEDDDDDDETEVDFFSKIQCSAKFQVHVHEMCKCLSTVCVKFSSPFPPNTYTRSPLFLHVAP